MGVDYASLRKANPDIVYLYAAAYGASGPSSRRPAYAPTLGAIAGTSAYQLGWRRALTDDRALDFAEGKRLYGQLRRANGVTGNADATAALGVGTALLLGLVARRRTGHGQALQTSMICTNAYALSDDFIDYEGKPERPLPDAELLGMGALYRLYRASEGWVFLACPLAGEWEALCRALHAATGGAVDLAADPRFATDLGRRDHDAALAAALTRCFGQRPAGAWEALLTGADVACVAVSEEPFSHFTIASPVMCDNGFVAEVEHPVFGKHLRHGPVVSLSRTPGVVGPAPLTGQHTRALLAELGYDDGEIAALEQRGVVRAREYMRERAPTA
jgi:crotonobetainyl-CoA:carnitine CoA-transferase CaiB-like acyl-CoA transferase